MFWDNFIELCVKNNVKPNPVAKSLGISSGSVTNWKKGVAPNSTTLKKIADYFGVSVDYLLGKESTAQPSEHDELNEYLEEIRTRPEMKMLFSITKNASKEDVEKAVKVIEAMLEN